MHVPFLETTRRPRRTHLVVGAIGAILALALLLVLHARYFGPADASAPMQDFIVSPDETFEEIAGTLKTQGYIKSITAFKIAYASAGHMRDIPEGGYRISASMDAWTVAEAFAEPPYLAWITFPPGLRKEQIANLLAKKLNWTPEEKEHWIEIDTAAFPSEGVYYGDTYLIPSDQAPAQVAARLRGRFEELFAEYAPLAAKKNVSWTEVLTMASLIEREAAKDDKHLIAGILWNRINKGMRLQVDATLQYIRGEEGDWWPVPSPEDKQLDSPFNTYKYEGLPPHPIANPSMDSIEAALNPTKTNCLYYLHDSDGEIHCSATYTGQVQNVNRYLK